MPHSKHSWFDQDDDVLDTGFQPDGVNSTDLFHVPLASPPPPSTFDSSDGTGHGPPPPPGTTIAVLSGDGDAGEGDGQTQTVELAGATSGGAASSGFTINITWDSSVNNAPAAFKNAVMAVVQYLESKFTDPVTVNINVGYGAVNGQPLDAGALGESLTYLSSFSYAQIKNAFGADSKSSDDASAVASLPGTDPVGGSHSYWVTTAEAKALGLLAANGTSLDGYVGFASGSLFDYDNSNGVSPGLYDFFGVVAHEFTEIMGRQTMDGQTFQSLPSYEPEDLFHYSSAGVRAFAGTTSGYFSHNGGTTNLGRFNTNSNGDFGDWSSSVGNDSFLAFSNSGVVNPVTASDLRVMDVIGWDAAPTALPDLTAGNLALNGASVSYQINDATASAAASHTGIYLSADGTISTADTLIGTYNTPALSAGGSDSETVALSFPTNLTPGTYFVGAIADYDGQISESAEGNNVSNVVPIILGNDSANTLTGTSGHDTIVALGGDDTIDGAAGADTMVGGLGNDIYFVDDIGDIVTEGAGQGTDTVESAISYTLPANVENLVLLPGMGPLAGTGNSLANVITGNADDNMLTGGAGNDTIAGGAGTDNAVFSGTASQYSVSYNNANHTLTITDLRGGSPDGTDTVTGTEFFQFSDQTVDVLTYASQTVNNPDGSRTVTTYDATDSLPWSTRVTTYDSASRMTSQTYNEDNGTVWANSYDAANTANWTWSTTDTDQNGNLVSKVTTFDDGTHSLAVHDNTGTNDWADFTVAFDADWNIVSENGTNHDSTPMTPAAIAAAYDNVVWYTHPVDPAHDFLIG